MGNSQNNFAKPIDCCLSNIEPNSVTKINNKICERKYRDYKSKSCEQVLNRYCKNRDDNICKNRENEKKYILKGCYKDSDPRDLPEFKGYLTLEQCRNEAINNGRDYYGMQYPQGDGNNETSECWIGNSYGKYGSVKCTENKNKDGYYMGSAGENAVYENVKPINVKPIIENNEMMYKFETILDELIKTPLKISKNTDDYTLIGTNKIDNEENTRIVISGKNRGELGGKIEYISTNNGTHDFYTNNNKKLTISDNELNVNIPIKSNGLIGMQDNPILLRDKNDFNHTIQYTNDFNVDGVEVKGNNRVMLSSQLHGRDIANFGENINFQRNVNINGTDRFLQTQSIAVDNKYAPYLNSQPNGTVIGPMISGNGLIYFYSKDVDGVIHNHIIGPNTRFN